MIQKPEAEKCWKSSFSVSWQCPKGWTYWLRPILLTHLFRAIWKAFKSELSCNDVLTNNTKALVYGANSRGEPGPCPRLRHNGCYSWTEHLWVIIWHNGWWQVIREDFNFRGDDGQRTSSLPPFTPIPSLLCYLSHVTCYPKNAESGRWCFQLREQKRRNNALNRQWCAMFSRKSDSDSVMLNVKKCIWLCV